MLKQKTTWAGILAIVSGIGQFIMTHDTAAASTSVVTGLGLIFAADR